MAEYKMIGTYFECRTCGTYSRQAKQTVESFGISLDTLLPEWWFLRKNNSDEQFSEQFYAFCSAECIGRYYG